MYEFDFRKFIYRSFVRHFPPYKLSLRHCVNRTWDMKNRQPQYCKYGWFLELWWKSSRMKHWSRQLRRRRRIIRIVSCIRRSRRGRINNPSWIRLIIFKNIMRTLLYFYFLFNRTSRLWRTSWRNLQEKNSRMLCRLLRFVFCCWENKKTWG